MTKSLDHSTGLGFHTITDLSKEQDKSLLRLLHAIDEIVRLCSFIFITNFQEFTSCTSFIS